MNSKNNKGVVEEVQMTVYHYFTEIRGLKLEYSGDFPCINVGKPKRPTYIPIEVNFSALLFYSFCIQRNSHAQPYYALVSLYIQHCELVSLQRYTKSLSSFQKASLVENSRQRPHERMASLANVGLLLSIIHETLNIFYLILIYVISS